MAITLTDGTDTITLKVDSDLSSVSNPIIVEHAIPERQGSILQFLGRRAQTVQIDGYTQTAADITQLKTWADAGTQLTYTDTLDVVNTSGVTMVITAPFVWKRMPGRPETYYRYSFVLKEDA